jgi:DNA-binding CsgD family transcriptional regulator
VEPSTLPCGLVAALVRELRARERRPAFAERLTAREAEVLGLLREGLTTAEIADRLFVAPVTVRTHVASVLRKLGVPDHPRAFCQRFEPSKRAAGSEPGGSRDEFVRDHTVRRLGRNGHAASCRVAAPADRSRASSVSGPWAVPYALKGIAHIDRFRKTVGPNIRPLGSEPHREAQGARSNAYSSRASGQSVPDAPGLGQCRARVL